MISTFGQMPDGRAVHSVAIGEGRLKVQVLSYGASVQSVLFNGAQMVVGSERFEPYLGPLKYAGAVVGRVANRIAGARAMIDGVASSLDANEPNGACLHGGSDGAGQLIWTILDHSAAQVTLTLHLPDGHMGFPGALDVQARYRVEAEVLRLEITATSDADTLCSFAPHGYWNLSGEANIDAHELRIAAEHFLPVDAALIPTGEVAPLKKSAFDFSQARAIGGAGIDHNFCLSRARAPLCAVVWLHSPKSGVTLEVASTETGVQIYDGRHLRLARAGLAIEPQVWPDAVNQTGFPSMTLRKGETYRVTSEFRLHTAD
ncbi:aldose epimerase family protein [Planktotalea arctica]|uniref:aldose epimerase family protein n=1 Tax=Planktotalea arctica TaxID=1481893 RepID=UPI000A172640|nr:aldose epimerase family protein [Planktotalea arctica]